MVIVKDIDDAGFTNGQVRGFQRHFLHIADKLLSAWALRQWTAGPLPVFSISFEDRYGRPRGPSAAQGNDFPNDDAFGGTPD
jgi:hypothetical protein